MNRRVLIGLILFFVASLGIYTFATTTGDDNPTNSNEIEEDTTAPVITLNGDPIEYVTVGITYTDPGATATDNVDGNLTEDIVKGGTVNTNIIGSYELTYDVTDDAGNDADTVTRVVVVSDPEDPIIRLIGDREVTIEVFGNYIEEGAIVTDNHDTGLTATITGTVITNAVGTYTVYYNATDLSGNDAVQITRLVHVVDTTIPVINLTNTDLDIEIEMDITNPNKYIEEYGIITDNYDTDRNIIDTDIKYEKQETDGTYSEVTAIDTSIVAEYHVIYNATDANDNKADEVVRIVNVIDTIAPIFTVSGNSTTWTNQNVTLAIENIVENGSGLADAPYSFDGGNNWQVENTKTFDKNQTVYVWVKDKAKNIEKQEIIIDKIDKVSPTVSIRIEGKKDGDVYGKDITVIGEVDPSEKNITSHWFEIINPDGSKSYSYKFGTSSLIYSFKLDTSKGSGTYRIRYVAADKAGNRNDNPNFTNPTVETIIVDANTATSTIEVSEVVNGKFTVSGKATDDMRLNRVYVQLVDKTTGKRCGGTTINLLTPNQKEADWSITYDIRTLKVSNSTESCPADNYYAAAVTATDNLGNSTTTPWTEQFFVENPIPKTTINVSEVVNGKFTVSGKATDNDRLNRVYVQLVDRTTSERCGGTTINLLTPNQKEADWSVEYDVRTLYSVNNPTKKCSIEGYYAAHANVTDNYGNSSASGWTQNFYVDTTPPTVTYNGNNQRTIWENEIEADKDATYFDINPFVVTDNLTPGELTPISTTIKHQKSWDKTSGNYNHSTVKPKVDLGIPGIYRIDYNYKDNAGNTIYATKFVPVKDTGNPTITEVTDFQKVYNMGSAEPDWANAISIDDNSSLPLNLVITKPTDFNMNIPGEYIVKIKAVETNTTYIYEAWDTNTRTPLESNEIEITIKVIDHIPPEITYHGFPDNLTDFIRWLGGQYQIVTATDNYDTSVDIETSLIYETTNSYNVWLLGEFKTIRIYGIKITATDDAGNTDEHDRTFSPFNLNLPVSTWQWLEDSY